MIFYRLLMALVVNQWGAEMYRYKLNKAAQCSRFTNLIFMAKAVT